VDTNSSPRINPGVSLVSRICDCKNEFLKKK
jgi:hypothetical protein